jgi:2-polyprenyl-6-methoxyphenol hydroxylase-like FAD-dependent oxidoreductase
MKNRKVLVSGAAMQGCEDLYFDAVSQVEMDSWSRGRVALVGDACFAPSLLSGQGSSFAMAGAYLLAGELGASDGDYEAAFGRHQSRFKPFIDTQQEAAVRAIRWYAPRTPLDLWLRNAAIRLIALPFVSRRVGKRFVDIPYDLPDYPSRRA